MKIKQGMRYYLHEYRRSAIVYYIVVAALIVASFILTRVLFSHSRVSIGGMDMATMIFLFVVGLNSFKSEFSLFLQSGLSRRTTWASFLLAGLTLSVIMGIIDSLLPVLLRPVMQYGTLFSDMYGGGTGSISLTGVVWMIVANFAAVTFGFFITTAYYRMNRPTKILVSVGVPTLLFVVLPLVEVFVPGMNFFTSLMRFYVWAMGLGFSATYPLHAIGSMAVFSVLMAGLSYLLVFRASLKEA